METLALASARVYVTCSTRGHCAHVCRAMRYALSRMETLIFHCQHPVSQHAALACTDQERGHVWLSST